MSCRKSTPRWPLARSCAAAAVLTLCAGLSAQPRSLSKRAALELGLARNFDHVSQTLSRARTDMLARASLTPYSPSLQASTSYGEYQPIMFAPGVEKHLGYSFGLSWRSLWGTTIKAEASMDQRLPGSTDPVNGASASVSLSQPLLKDGWQAASLPVREARQAARVQGEIYRSAVNQLLASVETAYWNLALAQADVVIKTRSRDLAKSQRDDTAENIRRGILADSEIYVVEENVVIFEQNLMLAEEGERLAQRELAETLAYEPDVALLAEDPLEQPDFPAVDAVAAIELAVRVHPDILAQRHRVELAQVRASYWSNQTLPNLDLTGSAALRGWDSRYSDAWRRVLNHPDTDLRAGLTFSVPLDRGAVNAGFDAAMLDARREENELKRGEARVRFDVSNALTDLTTNLRLVSLAKTQVDLAERKLTAQNEKYRSGLSTLADVVRFQRDLDNALSAHKSVIRSALVARARFLASQGTLADTVDTGPRP